MRALTISQPYASLIADGLKPVENRRWPTKYRGPLAIHAGKGTQYLDGAELAQYPTGAVIATCQLIACFSRDEAIVLADQKTLSRELMDLGWELGHMLWLLGHEHCEGPLCWVLSDVAKLPEPIPARGRQGLWECREVAT